MNRRKVSPGVTWLTILSLALTLAAGTLTGQNARAKVSDNSAIQDRTKYAELSRFATDLTALVQKRRSRSFGANSEAVDKAISVLATKKRNPVLIEDASLNVRSVAEGVAQRIVAGKVPTPLLNKRLFSLNLDALFAGLKTPAEADTRLNAVFAEVAAANGEIILFVD